MSNGIRNRTTVRPRMKTIERTEHSFVGICRKHEIIIDQEHDGSFYIIVHAPSGEHAYDGWWRGSCELDDAIAEALVGSLLAERAP